MADVKQAKTEATKINDRLQNCPNGAQTTVTTNPMRTVTNVYSSGSQSHHGPKGGRNNG